MAPAEPPIRERAHGADPEREGALVLGVPGHDVRGRAGASTPDATGQTERAGCAGRGRPERPRRPRGRAPRPGRWRAAWRALPNVPALASLPMATAGAGVEERADRRQASPQQQRRSGQDRGDGARWRRAPARRPRRPARGDRPTGRPARCPAARRPERSSWSAWRRRPRPWARPASRISRVRPRSKSARLAEDVDEVGVRRHACKRLHDRLRLLDAAWSPRARRGRRGTCAGRASGSGAAASAMTRRRRSSASAVEAVAGLHLDRRRARRRGRRPGGRASAPRSSSSVAAVVARTVSRMPPPV